MLIFVGHIFRVREKNNACVQNTHEIIPARGWECPVRCWGWLAMWGEGATRLLLVGVTDCSNTTHSPKTTSNELQ